MLIHLRNLKLHAYHGLYAEEAITGGDFEINLTATLLPIADVIDNIEDTLNYVSVYELVKAQMSIKTPLLETVAMRIVGEIFAKFPKVESVEISIFKLHPPIEAFNGSVGVTYKKSR